MMNNTVSGAMSAQITRVNDAAAPDESLARQLDEARRRIIELERIVTSTQAENERLNRENDRLNAARLTQRQNARGTQTLPPPAGGGTEGGYPAGGEGLGTEGGYPAGGVIPLAGLGIWIAPLPAGDQRKSPWDGEGSQILSQTEAARYLSKIAGRTIQQYQVHRWMKAGHFQTVTVPGKAALHVMSDSLYVPLPGRAGRRKGK